MSPVDSIKAKSDEGKVEAQQGPQGVGMAVAFDWGLAAQILVTPTTTLLLGMPGLFKQLGPLEGTLLSTVISLPVVGLLAVFGEGVRRGWRWTRPIQAVANTVLFLGGLVLIPTVITSIGRGNYWPLVTDVILLIFSPLIAWRMFGKRSKQWYDTVSSVAARKRHGGAWPFLISAWAAVGGILQAIAVLHR